MILPAAALLAYRRAYHHQQQEEEGGGGGGGDDSYNDGLEKTWTKQLAKEVDELQRPFRDAVLRCHGGDTQQQQQHHHHQQQPQASNSSAEALPTVPREMMMAMMMDPPPTTTTTTTTGTASSASTIFDESSSSTSCFSSTARKEWIKAVFGTSIQQPRGQGMAKIDYYTSTKLQIVSPVGKSLGITIQRLTLGLYVRSVKVGSEASILGVKPNSILVSINGICLLAEPSKQALERLWQYEGKFTKIDVQKQYSSSNTTTTTSTTTRTSSSRTMEENNKNSNSNNSIDTELVIQDPVEMTFYSNGKLYKKLFLSNPKQQPYGIEWGPCGNFALVKRNVGSEHAGTIPKGSIVFSVNQRDDLDHTTAAEIIRQATTNKTSTTTTTTTDNNDNNNNNQNTNDKTDIELTLVWPPSMARSGYWERRQQIQQRETTAAGVGSGTTTANTTTTTTMTVTSPLQKSVPLYTQHHHDGVQIKVHSIFSPGGGPSISSMLYNSFNNTTNNNNNNEDNGNSNDDNNNNNNEGGQQQDISQLAAKVSAGQVLPTLSFSKKKCHCVLSKVYQPCPKSLEGKLLCRWNVHEALLFLIKSHWIMMVTNNIIINNSSSRATRQQGQQHRYHDDDNDSEYQQQQQQIYSLDSYKNLIQLCQMSFSNKRSSYNNRNMLSALLLPLIACSFYSSSSSTDDKERSDDNDNNNDGDNGLFDTLVQLAKTDRKLAPQMELLAMASKHSTLQSELKRIRLHTRTTRRPTTSLEAATISEEKKMSETDELFTNKTTTTITANSSSIIIHCWRERR